MAWTLWVPHRRPLSMIDAMTYRDRVLQSTIASTPPPTVRWRRQTKNGCTAHQDRPDHTNTPCSIAMWTVAMRVDCPHWWNRQSICSALHYDWAPGTWYHWNMPTIISIVRYVVAPIESFSVTNGRIQRQLPKYIHSYQYVQVLLLCPGRIVGWPSP